MTSAETTASEHRSERQRALEARRGTESTNAFAAVDLGASSGRVVLGHVDAQRLEIEEVHRFANVPVSVSGTLWWDVLGLFRETLAGVSAAARRTELASIGIDSWAIDYGLLDASGSLLGNPVHYRDPRTEGAVEQVLDVVSPEELYATTGIQLMPINTLFQLIAEQRNPSFALARTLLLLPDLFGYWLTGNRGAELTNASTTQLLDIRSGRWATELATRLGLDPEILPPLRRPGDLVGSVLPAVAEQAALPAGVPVVAVASHDTASAVVALPAESDRFAYISCGTWALVGVELDKPILTEESRRANFTNEGGVDGTIRYLRNVMGLWLLQESERVWRASGWAGELAALLDEATGVKPFRAVVDVDDHDFLAPGDMPARIARHCTRTGQPAPSTRAETVRCILDSLALAFRRTLREALDLSGRTADAVHLVGGGSRNELLCQLTADACGLPVVAGPAEAAALGNILVQARAAGAVDGDVSSMRRLVRNTQPLRRYEPWADDAAWRSAEARLSGS